MPTVFTRATVLTWLLLLPVALACRAGEAHRSPAVAHLAPPLFVGAWRLVSIGLTVGGAKTVDPFYQPDSTGVIIYDASGWMSVQIVAPHRLAWPVPHSRPAADADRDAHLKSAAFDGYYAYYGTWDFDQATAVMTHHVTASLLPAETGKVYTQEITLDGDRLTFVGRGREHGRKRIRTKVWERIVTPH